MGTGKGNAKTKSYCVKHRGIKKGGVDNHGDINHSGIRVVCGVD